MTTYGIIERKLDNQVLYLIFIFEKSTFLLNKILKILKREMDIQCILSFLKYYVIKLMNFFFLPFSILIWSPESRVQSPGSRVQSRAQSGFDILIFFSFDFNFNLKSRVQSPKSRVQGPESSPGFNLGFVLGHWRQLTCENTSLSL